MSRAMILDLEGTLVQMERLTALSDGRSAANGDGETSRLKRRYVEQE